MKHKFIFFSLLIAVISFFGVLQQTNFVYADCEEGAVETNLFGCVKEDENGCGIYTTLNLVLTVLTYGVGIAATVGLVISAIMYLTAGNDSGKTSKAKTRIFEIIIGLTLYAMMWALLNWLLPGGLLNNSGVCEAGKQVTSSEKTTNITKKKSATKTPSAKANEMALKLANTGNKPNKAYKAAIKKYHTADKSSSGDGCRKKGMSCGIYVSTVMRATGIASNFPKYAEKIYPYVKNRPKKWKRVTGKLKPGDIQLHLDSGGKAKHVSIIVRNKNGKLVTAEASHCDFYPKVQKKVMHYHSKTVVYRYVGK